MPQPRLTRNRWALAGTVLYLSEFVVIIAASPPGPFGPLESAQAVTDAYAGEVTSATFAAVFFSVVLLGRILFFAAVRAAVPDAGPVRTLMGWAVVTAGVAVALEVAVYGVVAGAAQLAEDGGSDAVVVGLDHTAFWLNQMIIAPIGVSVLAAGAALLLSGFVARWLGWLPVVAGAMLVAGALFSGASGGSEASDTVSTLGVLPMWIWMIALGVVLYRTPAEAEPGLETGER